MTQNHAILNNLEELELFKEYTRIQENGDYISLLEFWREKRALRSVEYSMPISSSSDEFI